MPSRIQAHSLIALLLGLSGLARPCCAHVGLLAPNGGEVLPAGSTFTIQWQIVVPHQTLNWDLEYSVTGPNGPWLPIAIDLPVGNTSHQWTVPSTLSGSVRVRVTQDNVGTDYSDISDADLTIAAAATFTPFGQGCAGNLGIPTLAPLASELPRIGTTSHLRAANLAPSMHPVVLAIGLSTSLGVGPNGTYALPLSLAAAGLPGCMQYVSIDFTSFYPAASGQVDWPLTVPNAAALAGFELYVQAASLESPSGLALSNAVAATVGY